MIFGYRARFFLISCVIFQLAGTIFATDANADRRQLYINNETQTDYNPAAACMDNGQRSDMCAQASKPCHCEENRYEMYTYCKRSCGYCGVERLPQRFWRVVNWAPLNRTWFVSEIQFFKSRHDKTPIPTNNPASAIASSTYLSFPASHAFDGDRKTQWLPDGWWERMAGGDWIGYDFPAPVDINAVRIISDYDDSSDVSGKILVEAGPTAFGPFQTKWMSVNPDRNPDMKFNNPRCPLFWKRFMTDKEAFCYKLVTEYLTWSEARDKCGTYGGDIVSINSHEEQVFVQQELLACGYTWIGMNDRDKEGHFSWSDGRNGSFYFWATDVEADNQMNQMEDCVAMQKDGEWRTFHCDNRFYFFCKKRILMDNDKIVKPNTAHRHTQQINQTLPEGVPPPKESLPTEYEYPPNVTPPPPPPYPYAYPTVPPPPSHHTKHPKHDKAQGEQTDAANHPGEPNSVTQAGATDTQPGTSATQSESDNTRPAAGTSQSVENTQPAAEEASPPADETSPSKEGAASATEETTPADAAPVAPAPAVQAPAAPVQPAIAIPLLIVHRPKIHAKPHKHHAKKLKKKHHKLFHGTFRAKKTKKVNHKKKIVKTNVKKATHDDDDEEISDDDFLDMVARSDIPQPKLPELSSNNDNDEMEENTQANS